MKKAYEAIEDKVVTLSHAKGSLTFPANFQLLAVMNPCTCNHSVVTKYQKRISGPMLDRNVPRAPGGIDIHTCLAWF